MNEAAGPLHEEYAQLSGYKKCVERIQSRWSDFRAKREERLRQDHRNGRPAEKVAESIIEDLFTEVLDWPLSGLNYQVHFADMIISDNIYKWLLIETKRPGALAWNRNAMDRALEQARSYADGQNVKMIAVSDGEMLYAAERTAGGLRDRVFVSLRTEEPPLDLWWLSVFGISRERRYEGEGLLPESMGDDRNGGTEPEDGAPLEELLHPKYHLPARCFAYVGHYGKTSSWKLPYLLADGSVDAKRLPKAIQSLFSNYRGARVRTVPSEALPAVIQTLEKAAKLAGHLPPRSPDPSNAYRLLQNALDQRAAEK